MMEFNDQEPLAYFITWTTYGTWLPGDERGWSTKRIGGIQQPNPLFAEMAKTRMAEPEFRMSTTDREIVEATIKQHCEVRRWVLRAVNPRTNHVHVVVTAPGYHPDVVYQQFKSWCTRKLKVAHVGRKNFWTERASRKWINTEEQLQRAVSYVLEAQDGDRGAEDWSL